MSQLGVGLLCRFAPHALPALGRLRLTGARIEETKLRPRRDTLYKFGLVAKQLTNLGSRLAEVANLIEAPGSDPK
jgi:hypothetical protein